MKQSDRAAQIIVTLLLAGVLCLGAPTGKALADGIEPFYGEVQCGGYNFCPQGWLPCEGQSLQIMQYEVLFSLIGTTYGGDGQTTFNLPDLRGRVMVHQGGLGSGLTNRILGGKGGTESHQTSQAELPAHTHSATALSGVGDSATPSANTLWGDSSKAPEYNSKAPTSPMSSAALASAGNSTPYSIMKPYLVNNCCINADDVNSLWPMQ
jgi:microcystin-dependent protein